MKIVVINGSARKGNTLAAIGALAEGVGEKHEIEIIQADKLNMAPCKGCGACGCVNGCVDKDDTNPVIDKLVAADLIVFTSPVYWWGVSAQLKLVIDKCYCRGALVKGKNVGVIIVGGSPVEATQYRLIKEQFECIEKYLDWDIKFYKSYYANDKNDLAENAEAMNELKAIGAGL